MLVPFPFLRGGWGEGVSLVTDGFPSQVTSNAENMSIMLLWHVCFRCLVFDFPLSVIGDLYMPASAILDRIHHPQEVYEHCDPNEKSPKA